MAHHRPFIQLEINLDGPNNGFVQFSILSTALPCVPFTMV